MVKPQIHLPSKKLLMGAGGGVLLLFVLWYAVMALSFSAESLREKTLNALSQQLGAPVTALDLEQYSVLPVPELTLNSVQIRNHPKARHPSMLSASGVVVRPSLASLFGDLVVSVTFYDPELEFETFKDKTNSWNLPPQELPKGETALIQQLNFVDSQLHYADPHAGRDLTLDKLNFSLHFDAADDYEASGRFHLKRDDFRFTVAVQPSGGREVTFRNASSTYQLTGNYDKESGEFTGQQTLESQDLGQLLEVFLISGEQPPVMATGDQAYPFTFSSEIKKKGTRLTLSKIAIGGGQMQGEGQAIGLLGAEPEISAQLDFKQLSLDKLLQRGVFTEYIANTAQTSTIDGYRIDLPEDNKSSLPAGLKLTAAIKSEQAQLAGLGISNLQLAARLDHSVIDVAQFSGKLPGQGQFITKGKVEGSYDGLAFKGMIDVAGLDFATLFQPLLQNGQTTTLKFPEAYKRFRGRANLFVNPAVLRVSEGVMRLENMQLLGTILRQDNEGHKTAMAGVQNVGGEEGYRYEGAFRIVGADLDQLWQQQSVTSSQDQAVEMDSLFNWMQSLMAAMNQSRVNFKVNLEDAMLQQKKRDSINFRLLLNRGLFGLEEMEIPYNGTTLRGASYFTHPAKAKPKIEANIQLDNFNSESFLAQNVDRKVSMWRDENGFWSRKEFDILWLDKFDLNLKIDAGSITHGEYEMDNVKGEAEIGDGALQLRNVSAKVWGGVLAGNGRMLIAKLPTFTGNFTLSGFDFSKLHDVTDLFSSLYGSGSLRGDFSTTGVNPYSAIQNMKGTLSFAGSGLKVTGFNLANMVRAANAVRVVEDIDKLVAFANRGGETRIDTVQGNMNVDDGFLRTPGMQITTPEGNGSIKGQINLLDWQTNVAISIVLSALHAQNPPDIRLVFVGPLNEVGRSLDTQALESFVAKQAAERLLMNP